MAFSQNDVDLLLETGSIINKIQLGRELSPNEQETLKVGFKLFRSISDIDIEDPLQASSSLLENAANKVRDTIRKSENKKNLHDYLTDLLEKLYEENRRFTWNDIRTEDRDEFQDYARLTEIDDDNPYGAYLEIRSAAGIPTEEEAEGQENVSRLDEVVSDINQETSAREATQNKATVARLKEVTESPNEVLMSEINRSLDPLILSRLRNIIYYRSDYSKLSSTQIQTLDEAATLLGRSSGEDLFNELREHPESIGLELPEAEPEEKKEELVTNNNQVIAANVKEYQENQEKLAAQAAQTLATRSTRDQDLIKRMVQLAAIRRQTEVLLANADVQTRQIVETVDRETDPKTPLLRQVNDASQQIVTSILAQNNLDLPPNVVATAVDIITVSTLTGILSPSKPDELNILAQVAIPQFDTDISKIYQQIEAATTTTSLPVFDNPNSIYPNTSINLSSITLPPTAISTTTIATLPPPIQDIAEKSADIIAPKYTNATLSNKAAEAVVAKLSGTITKEQESELIPLLIAANLTTRAVPTTKGAEAALIIDTLAPVNPFITGAAVRAGSMGVDSQKLQEHLAANPTSKLAQFFQKNPVALAQYFHGLKQIENNRLGIDVNSALARKAVAAGTFPSDVRPPGPSGPLSGITRQFQSITNRVSGLMPANVSKVFNIVTHPVQAIQNYLGEQIGKRFVNEVAKRVISKIGNEALKKTAELLLKEGLTKGLASLATKLGAEALLAGTGVGVPVALLMLAGDALMAIGKQIGKGINSLVTAFTGEELDSKAAIGALVAAPLAFFGGIGMALGSATAVAASSATIILIGSTFLGFILYISVIAVAPIISSIAQLESGTATSGLLSTRTSSYTGPILPGCPTTWPVPAGHYITQGPLGLWSHRTLQAIDISVGTGTPVTSITSGVVTYASWGGGYGNKIMISSTTESGTPFSVIYGHLSEFGVSVGDKVGVGTVIGLSGGTSSNPAYTRPHLHVGYEGITYNSCPAGGLQIPEGCVSASPADENACLINGQTIYTK